MKNKYGFHFEYKIKTSLSEDFSYDEYFEPYTKEEILSSPLFNLIGNEYKSLFNDATNFDYHKENDFLCDISEKEILPNTINILMDAVYCINIALLNPILYDVLAPIESEIYLLSKISNKEKFIKLPRLMYGTNIHYIAMYTELIKYKVLEDKCILSTLLFLYNSPKNINKELAEELLIKINDKYSLKITNLSISNKDSIKDVIIKFCNFQNTNNKINYSLQIDFRDFDTFITLLKNKSIRNINDPNIFKNNCFCLVQVDDNYYFSFSGYEDKIYESLSKKILKALKIFFPDKKFLYCERTDDMLSYGYKNENGKFELFLLPKKLSEQNNLTDDELKWQYACCERKIFASKDFKLNESESMYIYCKYEPCDKCTLAIDEQEKKHSNFMFFAFIKDNIAFDKYLKEKNKKLHKEPKYLYTFIS